jgi:AcrR family transcriptional regulator
MTDKTPTPSPEHVHPKTAEETGFFFPNGAPVPPTHPDHGPMDQLPRMEDGRFAAYYYCSKAELKAIGLEDVTPPRRIRHDGWTAQKIADFLETLRASASVTDACRAVGMSRTSAYKLYHRKDSAHVRKAWDEALRHCTAVLATTAFDRAVNGTEYKVFHKGEFVGWQVRHDNRHLQWMLRVRDPLNWAPLDDLEGWMRHRGIEKPEPVDASLDRLADAEEAWGQRLPDEPREERLLPLREGKEKHAEIAADSQTTHPDPT